jgi:pyruvate dehydrogenase E1 component
LRDEIVEGGYWLIPPGAGTELALVASGAVVTEALEAHRLMAEDIPDAGLLVVTSADRLYRSWIHSQRTRTRGSEACHIERLLAPLPAGAGLVTILDGHSATLSWIGAVKRHRVVPLGVERFGQSGSIADLYHAYGLDADAIIGAAARLCVARW